MNALLSETFLFWFRAECKLWLASYAPKPASHSLSDTPFWAYLRYNSKNSGCLQLYYILNDSSATEDALFHAKSGKAVATYKLCPCTNIAVLLFCVQVRMTTKFRAPMTVYSNKRFPTKFYSLEIQTEMRLTSCCPAAIAGSMHYM